MTVGTNTVPTSAADDTFIPDAGTRTATLGYQIPLDTVTDNNPKTVTIQTFRKSDDLLIATHDIVVQPLPFIRVLEGDTVLPDATVTIEILNHSPQSIYTIYYGKTVGNPNSSGKRLLTMLTDNSGYAQATYSLRNLPADPPPNFGQPTTCNCFGVPYEMYSEALTQDSTGQLERLAFTQLTIDSGDLVVTRIELPSTSIPISTTFPITVTIQNTKAVTIARLFDIDFYYDPSPVVPSYRPSSFSFPGDIKFLAG